MLLGHFWIFRHSNNQLMQKSNYILLLLVEKLLKRVNIKENRFKSMIETKRNETKRLEVFFIIVVMIDKDRL